MLILRHCGTMVKASDWSTEGHRFKSQQVHHKVTNNLGQIVHIPLPSASEAEDYKGVFHAKEGSFG